MIGGSPSIAPIQRDTAPDMPEREVSMQCAQRPCDEVCAKPVRVWRARDIEPSCPFHFVQSIFKVHASASSSLENGVSEIPSINLDNIFVERLWRSVKYEEVYLKAYRNGSEARRGIDAYLDLYNRERPHQALGYRTPAQVFAAGRPLRCYQTRHRRYHLVSQRQTFQRESLLTWPLRCPNCGVHPTLYVSTGAGSLLMSTAAEPPNTSQKCVASFGKFGRRKSK